MKRFTIRTARKVAHVSNKAFNKASRLTAKVEDKATRILDGTDFSIKTRESTPFEKIFYNTLPHITPLNPAMPAVGSVPSVTLFLPTLDGKSFYGGTATAIFVAARLAHLTNRKIKIVQTLKTGRTSNLAGLINANTGTDFKESDIKIISVAERRYNVYGYISMLPEDIFIASAWWDAHLLNQLPLTKKFIYLVQDFEPIFYNNSDNYVLSEATYKHSSFIPLCNTKLMADFMKERKYNDEFSKGSLYFEPAVSRVESGTSIQKPAGEKRRLFLYGRPDVHRNLFFTALESIDYAFKADFLANGEWELCMGGQDGVPDIELSSGLKVKNLGKMSLDTYANFSKTVDIAVSLMMAPHPNYPTLEFSSIGSAVVTTKYSNKTDLTYYSKNIIASDTNVESIAGAIKQAAEMSYKERMKNIKQNNISSDWEAALDESLRKVIDRI
jgi:beta-1,2-rhamnosyltransferase WsaF-like protein